MTEAARILAEARSLGIEIEPRGERLALRPAAAVSSALLERVRTYKDTIRALLAADDGSADGGFRLIIEEAAPVRGPVELNAWTRIVDPNRCITADLHRLVALLAAFGSGRLGRMDPAGRILGDADEVLDRLHACGVRVRLVQPS